MREDRRREGGGEVGARKEKARGGGVEEGQDTRRVFVSSKEFVRHDWSSAGSNSLGHHR